MRRPPRSTANRPLNFRKPRSWDEAIVAYHKALELEPNDALTHYNLALALNYKGDAKQAVEEFAGRAAA